MVLAAVPILLFYRRSPVWGLTLPAIAGCYAAFTLDSAVQYLLGRGGMWKGRVQAAGSANPAAVHSSSPGERMVAAGELSSGKTHRDENFPVASLLIAPQHRGIILAFYRFVREADDIADHPHASVDEKLHLLDRMRRSLLGETDAVESGIRLRAQLAERGITHRHALDLLEAFRRDVTKLRYRDWDDLVDYCSVSAMPVGRFVLDVHGESSSIWPLNDALCAALQIINHLQDCGRDYRSLNRVYIPLDAFAAAGSTPAALSGAAASPQLRAAIRDIARQNETLLERSAVFAQAIRDRRLSLEVSVIHRLACDLNRRLLVRDPLSEQVHHGRAEAILLGISAVTRQLVAAGLRRKRTVLAGAPSP
jgi:squalene synthase HpnC